MELDNNVDLSWKKKQIKMPKTLFELKERSAWERYLASNKYRDELEERKKKIRKDIRHNRNNICKYRKMIIEELNHDT